MGIFNKKPSYVLNITEPCDQNWSNMTAVQGGKHCTLCEKKVTDFTKLSDQELLKVIENEKGNFCGRLNVDQLNRAIQSRNDSNFKNQLYKLLASIGIIASSTQLNAAVPSKLPNQIVSTINHVSVNLEIDHKVKNTSDSLYVFSGKVVEDSTNLPIQSATIRLKDTNLEAFTSSSGEFKLKIPKNLIQDQLVFEISMIGYELQKLMLNKKELKIKKVIKLKEDLVGMNECIITGKVIIEKK